MQIIIKIMSKWICSKENLILRSEIIRIKEHNTKLRNDIKTIKKVRKKERSELMQKESQLRVREYRAIMKENKLNDLILQKEDAIKRARLAQCDFEEVVRDLNIFLRSKTLNANNIMSEKVINE